MSDFDFEKTMLDLAVNIPAMGEMRAAYKQAPLGFELVAARAKGANNAGGALVNHIRNGAHLKAQGEHEAAKQQAGMFECNYCGKLAGTNADNHYTNFPEHKAGKPTPPPTYPEVIPWIPPEQRTRQQTHELHQAIAKRDGKKYKP